MKESGDQINDLCEITVEEVELFRAIADTHGCPVPARGLCLQN